MFRLVWSGAKCNSVKSLAMVNKASGALRQACSSLDHTRTDHCYDGEDADLDNENSG